MLYFFFASLPSSGYKNNLLKERGMAKDCNMGESCSGSVSLRPPGCCLIHGSSHLIILARVGREAVEVRMRGAAGRSRANTESGEAKEEEQTRGQEECSLCSNCYHQPLRSWLFLTFNWFAFSLLL